MKRLAFVTGSRADYGIMRRYLELLNDNEKIDLKIIVTGALLSETYGHQVDLIYQDGYEIDKEVQIHLDTSSNETILHAMAQALDEFATYFEKNKYDLLIILGDRYEMLSVAISAAMQRIPILHVHGGEATYGNYDEFIRHSITKMSLYHFTATEEYRKRVIQLGENPERVFYLGALGAENCLYIDEKNVPENIKALSGKKYFVVLYHPETLTNINIYDQINELIKAIDNFREYQFVFIGTNADTFSDKIRRSVNEYVSTHNNAIYYENLHTDAYHYLVRNAISLIGNSSSGIIEAPSLGVYTINVGERQAGRVRGNSVIDIRCQEGEIVNAIRKILEKKVDLDIYNPYFKNSSAELYYKTTLKILDRIDSDIAKPKEFFNLDW